MNRHHYEHNTYYPSTKSCLNNVCPKPATARQTTTQRYLAQAIKSDQYTLFAFMCRWTCSSCWRLAETLGQKQEWFAARGLSVVLVGQSHYLQPATRLAANLQLPFKLISDDLGALRRLYGLKQCTAQSHRRTLVLTDKKGRVKYWQHSKATGGEKVMGALLAAIQHHTDS